MALRYLLVDAATVVADGNGFPALALGWRHKSDAAVAVPIVVPAHERRHPDAGLLHAGEWPAWVVRPTLDDAEQRLRVGVSAPEA